jgi:hypothetical protein
VSQQPLAADHRYPGNSTGSIRHQQVNPILVVAGQRDCSSGDGNLLREPQRLELDRRRNSFAELESCPIRGRMSRRFRSVKPIAHHVAHNLRVPEITTPLVTEEDVAIRVAGARGFCGCSGNGPRSLQCRGRRAPRCTGSRYFSAPWRSHSMAEARHRRRDADRGRRHPAGVRRRWTRNQWTPKQNRSAAVVTAVAAGSRYLIRPGS